MALTEYDKKNLSSSDQKKIQAATDKWNAANAAGDTKGMEAAAAEAAAVRNNAGYKTDSSGNYSGSYSSGGGSSKNSQYSAPNLGSTWDANTDYQAIIKSAVDNGDYQTAAKAEQLRNQKITATGSNYNTTNAYTSYLDIDYGTLGQQQMANGASWQDVLATYNSRYKKAMEIEGLEKYADDPIQKAMMSYVLANMPKDNQQDALDQYNQYIQNYDQNNPKAEYDAKYDPQIEALLSEILNRKDFSYNAANDPLYQQYAKMYQREGERAMKETLAEAAASAGGMNTYAITAAQQANSYYNSQLNDKIPELYQLAYEMYLNDKESKVQDLGILQSMDATQYNRYRDTINDYYADKNFAYGVYQDAVQQGNWQANYDYNSFWDNKLFENENYWNNKLYENDNYWKNKEFDYNEYWDNKEWDHDIGREEIEDGRYDQEWNHAIEREGIEDSRYDQEWEHELEREGIEDGRYADETSYDRNLYDQESAKEEVWKYIDMGVMPNADLIARAGMSETDVSLAVEAVKAEKMGSGSVASSGSSSKKSSSGGIVSYDDGDDDDGYTGKDDTTTSTSTTESSEFIEGMKSLGLPLTLDPNTIVDLEKAGAIKIVNGKPTWNTGWNSSNYLLRLANAKKINPLLYSN